MAAPPPIGMPHGENGNNEENGNDEWVHTSPFENMTPPVQNTTYGPDTAELMEELARAEQTGKLVVPPYITSLPPLPETLTYLDCDETQLTSLPPLPASLTTLRCNMIPSLTSLPELPAGLTTLHCGENHSLTSLPALPASLEDLYCPYTPLTSLPELPVSLKDLDCSSTQLTTLPELPASLGELYCAKIPLTSLPALPASLKDLDCSSTQLTSLPALPASLKELFCNDCPLTSLPALTASLELLDCSSTQLTSLPALPASLEMLFCNDTQLTSLPELPVNLKSLNCSSTQLTSLPELPASLVYLDCTNTRLPIPGIVTNKEDEIRAFVRRLAEHGKPIEDPWQGWHQSDLAKFDTVFSDNEKVASDYSCCPICLHWTERSEACNYLQDHNCSLQATYYHKELYNKYKNPQGGVTWCTICGRISLGHRHYKLGLPDGPKPELSPSGGAFEPDCRATSGGGGLPEKIARLRRLREVARDVQEDIGKRSTQSVIEELVEEMWKAPLIRQREVNRIQKRAANMKKTLRNQLRAENPNISSANLQRLYNQKLNLTKGIWNIPTTNFPANVRPEPVEDAPRTYPNIVRSPENLANPDLQPLELPSGMNSVTLNDEIPVIQFRHRQEDGTVFPHEGVYISKERLPSWIDEMTSGAWATAEFGYCFAYPECKARLYPDEIRPFVSDELYERYKAKFNEKFGKETAAGAGAGAHGGRRRTRKRKLQRGGAIPLFQELTDATCVPPWKGGSRQGTKTRRKRISKQRQQNTRRYKRKV